MRSLLRGKQPQLSFVVADGVSGLGIGFGGGPTDENWCDMPQLNTESDPSKGKRGRVVRVTIATAVSFGPFFVLAFAVGQAGRIGAAVGVGEAIVAEHIRGIVAVALLFAFGVSYLLLALLKRRKASTRGLPPAAIRDCGQRIGS